jgi:mono/diheme cytochrome c family protein
MNLATLATYASVYRTIGLVLMVVVGLGFVAYVAVNVLFAGKEEIGSEIELAANRKPYYDDEVLEGPRLDRALTWGLLTLFVLAVGIPVYWVMEPGRQENEARNFGREFADRGAALFAPTEEGGFNCAFCHGGMDAQGNAIAYNLTEPDGSVTPVVWRAPALNTVLLRYSREEVKFILTYGRPGSPMPAWGVEGGGPMNDQQLQNLIDYLESIQITPEEAQQQAADELDTYMAATDENGDRLFSSPGEALFNLGLLDNVAGGAYACGRGHTSGWSYAEIGAVDGQENAFDGGDVAAVLENSGCGGALGPNLCNGDTVRQFPVEQDMLDFITVGSEAGKGYGRRGQGSGKMPGFGQRTSEDALFWINGNEARDFPVEDQGGTTVNSGMLTPEQIQDIVTYERGL